MGEVCGAWIGNSERDEVMEKVFEEKSRFSDRCVHNKFVIDQSLNTVTCGSCGKELNPMWVLSQLCRKEASAWDHLEYLEKQAEKAKDKNRCKCEHCKKMTRIHKPR